MPSGSQSNRAPVLRAASPACPAARPAGSSAACFHPAAAAKNLASHRFPVRRQLPERRGLSIPVPRRKILRAGRARYVRRPAPLRVRSDKQLARQSALSGPPRKQNRGPVLPPHLPVALCIPAKPLSPALPRVRRFARRNTPLLFDCSNFFLGDHDSRSGPFIRGTFGGHRKTASPHKFAATRQYRPAVTIPSTDAFFIQQTLQLVSAAVTLRTQSVSRAPIAQHPRKTQPVAVQNRSISSSFPSIARPVNHPEAEYTPQFGNTYFRVASRQIDLVLIFLLRALRRERARIFHRLKHQRVSLSSHFYPARKRQRAPALSSTRQLQHGLHMSRPKLPIVRLDALHNSPNHPLAECFCPFTLIGVLCVLCVLCVKIFFLP